MAVVAVENIMLNGALLAKGAELDFDSDKLDELIERGVAERPKRGRPRADDSSDE